MYRFHGDIVCADILLRFKKGLYKLNIPPSNDFSADADAIFQQEIRHFPRFCVAGKHFRFGFNHVETQRQTRSGLQTAFRTIILISGLGLTGEKTET